MNRRPLAAAALVVTAVATLAVPAGAASSKDWTVQTLPCATGHKSAVVAYSPTHPWWLDDGTGSGGGILNPARWRPWFKNPCKGQWLLFSTWGGDPSEDSNTFWSAAPGSSGRISGEANGGMLGRLSATPQCDVGGADYQIVGAPDPCS